MRERDVKRQQHTPRRQRHFATFLMRLYPATWRERYGAEMLARYLPSLLRRGRVLLLCDGLDELAPSQVDTIGQELLVALPQRLRSVRVVLACRAAALGPLAERLPALAQCPQVTLLPMSNDEVRQLLHHAARAGQLGG